MIVVSDTSPLDYLVLIEAIHVLPRLYDVVYVPHQVIIELEHPGTPAAVREWVEHLPPWARVRNPLRIDAALQQNGKLDEGEIHAIALAMELNAQVLIDERAAYEAATALGLCSTGVLGVLDKAAEQNLLELKPALTRLTSETSFRFKAPLIDRLLERDVQRKSNEGRR